jgi:autotransporter-associated beta strand protein
VLGEVGAGGYAGQQYTDPLGVLAIPPANQSDTIEVTGTVRVGGKITDSLNDLVLNPIGGNSFSVTSSKFFLPGVDATLDLLVQDSSQPLPENQWIRRWGTVAISDLTVTAHGYVMHNSDLGHREPIGAFTSNYTEMDNLPFTIGLGTSSGLSNPSFSYDLALSQWAVYADVATNFTKGYFEVFATSGAVDIATVVLATTPETVVPPINVNPAGLPVRVGSGQTMGLNGGTVNCRIVVDPGGTLSVTDNTTTEYQIDNYGTITVASGKTLTASGSIVLEDGSTVSGTIVDNALMSFVGSSNRTYSASITGTGAVAKSGSGNLTLSGTNTFAGGVILDDGTLTVANDSALGSSTADPGVTVNGGTLNLNGHVVTVNDLALLGGKIDMTTGGLIVPQSNFSFVPSGGQDNEYLANGTGNAEYGNAAIHDALQEGANFASGYWDGTHGILSSTAATDLNYHTAVGDAWNDYLGYTSWRGKTVGSDSLLVSYTYYGDADMSGTVTTNDYSIWSGSASMGYGTATGSIHTEWIDGDWDGNGICDSEDSGLWTESHNLTSLGFNAS